MARPQKEGMDYFPHDTDALNDEKIEVLKLLYGNDGYAFYFILLERIYRETTFELDISDAETIQILCKKIEVTQEKFYQMLETAIKKKAFDREAYEERKVLTSNGIKKRANVVIEKRSKMRDRYSSKVSDAETREETGVEMPQSKVKESKVKESKEEDIYIHPQNLFSNFQKEFVRPLSPIEIEQLKKWQEQYEEAIILEALKTAVINAKLSFKYIDSILLNWEKRNLRTIREIQENEKAFTDRKQKAIPQKPSQEEVQSKELQQKINVAADMIQRYINNLENPTPEEITTTINQPILNYSKEIKEGALIKLGLTEYIGVMKCTG